MSAKDESTRKQRMEEVIKRLEGMKWEASTYYVAEKRAGNENDAAYLERIYQGCANMIAILKNEPLPHPPKEISS